MRVIKVRRRFEPDNQGTRTLLGAAVRFYSEVSPFHRVPEDPSWDWFIVRYRSIAGPLVINETTWILAVNQAGPGKLGTNPEFPTRFGKRKFQEHSRGIYLEASDRLR